ncbi:type VII secretion target [Phycicoccus sonneratiae]|uniref:Excreted virulence factor EspC (Type VII ESX diderm) n=1 Tax=Phycicoccus sonneratiae TaxID=2807628 RepID=A0ABS2CN11_9MICO|nr:type VII secretion target [Phycicoccus sonneraticus]MBM6401267.1 hypothetical protein [Phycicoccus sonneraticus]
MRDDEHRGSPGSIEKFEVDPAAVRAMGKTVRDLADSAGEAQTYATGNLLLTNYGGSIMLTLCEWMYDLEGTVGDWFGDLAKVSRDSGVELGAAATVYRTTDERTSARLDRSYCSQ